MQLKVFLVVAFVTNVACLNMNEDPSSLVKILKKDPSSFVESLAGADSNTINEVINMLQVLINEGSTALQGLIDRKTEAKDKLDAATTDLGNAINTQTTAEEALHKATTTKSNADDAYVDAVDKQQTADSEHTTAVNILDTEGSLLKNNNDLMEEVIGMLQTLIENYIKSDCHLAYSSSVRSVGDYGNHNGNGKTLSECQDLCSRNPECKSFVVDQMNGKKCHLKSECPLTSGECIDASSWKFINYYKNSCA